MDGVSQPHAVRRSAEADLLLHTTTVPPRSRPAAPRARHGASFALKKGKATITALLTSYASFPLPPIVVNVGPQQIRLRK